MPVTKLTPIQKSRVNRLEPALKQAVIAKDLALIKSIVSDLQGIYLQTGNEAKLLMAKNRWYEVEMELGNLSTAERGLLAIRTKANKNTRVYLEASTLLAICYLRNNQIDNAEPIIREVLNNDNVIKAPERRTEFRKLVIERFDEEATLYALKLEKINDVLSEEIEKDVYELFRKNYTEEELYKNIGQQVPISAKNVLVRVDAFAKKQLPTAERLNLPSPTQSSDNEKIGRTVFSSVKRVLYKSICEKEGDLRKTATTGIVGLQSIVTFAITDAFVKLNIGIRTLIVGAITLILKLGLEVYCDRYRPIDIMEIR